MGFRYRKSIQIIPGVRMTVSPRGVSYSAGVKGMRVTRRADGKIQRTVSLPGTGLSHVSAFGGARRGSTTDRDDGAPSPLRPGVLAPRAEKDLYAALIERHGSSDLPRIGRSHPDHRVLAAALDGFVQFQAGTHARARELLAWVFAQGEEIATHPFTRKYLATATVTVEIADGISVQLPMNRTAVGLAVAELHQGAGDLDVAIATVEQLDPTSITALSLVELYSEDGRHAEVVNLTNGIANVDDATALLCALRGAALREQGFFDAARQAFKEALKSRSRAQEVRHRALLERASSYEKQNKNALARKDLEKILAENSAYPGLAAALAQLPS